MNSFKKVCCTVLLILSSYPSISTAVYTYSTMYRLADSDNPFDELDNTSSSDDVPTTNRIPICIRRTGIKMLMHWTTFYRALQLRYMLLKKYLFGKKYT